MFMVTRTMRMETFPKRLLAFLNCMMLMVLIAIEGFHTFISLVSLRKELLLSQENFYFGRIFAHYYVSRELLN